MSKPKVRGNGMGCAYKRQGETTWTAEVVIGWKFPDDPSKPKKKVTRRKGGFATKKEALAYCPQLMLQGNTRVRVTLQQVYESWKPFYAPRIGKSTMDNYLYAYKHFSQLHGSYMDLITTENLQACMDACESGKRTHENMKCVAGLLWKYAMDKNWIDRNVAENLYTGPGRSVQREPITMEEQKVIRKAIGTERYAEYIFCLCNLGFRPGEMLELRKDQLFCAPLTKNGITREVWYFVNGKKTEAGRDRVVVVPPELLPIILDRIFVPGTDLVFPQYHFTKSKKQKFVEFKKMSDAYFRVEIFKPMMARLGIAEGKVPYGARHSYADKLKKTSGSDKDKASLIGHSNYLFTQDKYQSSHLDDLLEIVSEFEM